MADLSGLHLGHGLQGGADGGLAVGAHHALDLQCLFHSLFLLVLVVQMIGSFMIVPVIPELEQIQPQGVGHHAEAGKAHGGGAEHGVQGQAQGDEHPGGQRNADGVVEKRPEQVLVDVPQGGPAKPDGGGHVQQTAVHQHHVRRVDGHVGSRADGDAGVGPGQGRGVVDAVAYHGHLAPLHQAADGGLLALRQHPGDDLIHPGLGPDGPGGVLVVAGEHHHMDTHIPQLPDCLWAVLLDDIRHGDDAQQLVVTAEKQRRFSGFCKCSGLLLHLIRDSCDCGNTLIIAAAELAAVQYTGQTVSGECLEIADSGCSQLLLFAVLQDCLCQRVFALLFQRQRHTIFTIGERDYIALLPLDENGEENEEGEVFIYRYSEDSEGNPSLDNIEDDEEYEAVSDRFDELLDEAAFEEMDD